jgi:type IV secretory pathway VirB6-like protein
MNSMCGRVSTSSVWPSPIQDVKDYISCAAVALKGDSKCVQGFAYATASAAILFGHLDLIYKAAKDNLEHTRICGDGWYEPNPDTKDFSKEGIIANKNAYVSEQIEDLGNPNISADEKNAANNKLSMNDKIYREYLYRGVEVEDRVPVKIANANKAVEEFFKGNTQAQDDYCKDVLRSKDSNGYYPRQRYYMKGSAPGNFNCSLYNSNSYRYDPLTNGEPFTSDRIKEMQEAYDCCVNRSENFICLENHGNTVFCEKDKNCPLLSNGILPVSFTTKSLDNGRLICAESYSFCPYNFSVQGGTTICDEYKDGITTDDSFISFYSNIDSVRETAKINNTCDKISEVRRADCSFDPKKQGKCKNYCQYLRHCVVTNKSKANYNSSLSSPYFSRACYDFKGDSLNTIEFGMPEPDEINYSVNTDIQINKDDSFASSIAKEVYNQTLSPTFTTTSGDNTSLGGLVPVPKSNFTAPIAQCIKETFENIFYNRYGQSFCKLPSEKPDRYGSCLSGYVENGDFIAKQGAKVGEISFFDRLQSSLKIIIKLVLTLSIMFYGIKILLGVGSIKKQELLLYIIKISLIAFFALGNAWQDFFFDGVYRVSDVASQVVFKMDVDPNKNKQDGCQFGTVNISGRSEVVNNKSYPAGKEYLAVWDTIDCKIARYMGIGPATNVANIFKIIIAGFFTSFNPILAAFNKFTIFFSVGLLIFAILLIMIAIRALHIFITSAMIIIMLVYISPIFITLSLFKKTEELYKKWLKQLIGISLQPIILFAYLAIMIKILDVAVIGNATFYGENSSYKTINCLPYCFLDYKSGTKAGQTIMTYDINLCNNDKSTEYISRDYTNPINNSIACLVDGNISGSSAFKSWPGLAWLGVGVQFLDNIVKGDGGLIILNILRSMLMLYILFTFMDSIPQIASSLMGGSAVKADSIGGAKQLFKNTGSLAKSVSDNQERTTGLARAGLDKLTGADKYDNKK